LNSRSGVILPHKKFTWADFFFGGGRPIKSINTDIPPVATPLFVGSFRSLHGYTLREK